MTSFQVVAVTGMQREAAMAAGDGVITLCGGGNAHALKQKIETSLTPDIRGVISFGIAGALSPELHVGDVLIGSSVISGGETFAAHAGWASAMEARLPHAKRAIIAGSDVMLDDVTAKAALYEKTRADAVDMESHIAARAAAERGLPFAALRIISDAADDALPPAARVALGPDGTLRLGAVLRSVLAKPAQIPALIRTGRNSNIAFGELLRCRNLLGVGIGFADFF